MVVISTRGAKLRRITVAGMKGSCSPAYFLRKLVLPGASKLGLRLSQRFRLFPELVQAVEQLRM